MLPNKYKAMLVYTGTKLGSNFDIKDSTKKEHKHDLVYSVKCPEEACKKTYNRETGRRLGKGINSNVYEYSVNFNHAFVTLDDFTILNLGYNYSKFKKKISEALFIKSNRSNFNKQDTSVPGNILVETLTLLKLSFFWF